MTFDFVNEGFADRGVRVIGGALLLLMVWIAPSWVGLVGIVPLVSGVVGFCPVYKIAGISTADDAHPA